MHANITDLARAATMVEEAEAKARQASPHKPQIRSDKMSQPAMAGPSDNAPLEDQVSWSLSGYSSLITKFKLSSLKWDKAHDLFDDVTAEFFTPCSFSKFTQNYP